VPTLLSVIPAPTFGGAANHCVQLRGPFERAGWRLVAVLPTEPGNAAPRLRDAGVEVLTTPMHRLRATADLRSHAALAATFVPEVRAIAALARAHDADVVQNHGDLNPHAGMAGRLAGRAVVWHIQDTRTPMALRRLTMPVACALADAFTTIGWELGRAHPGVLRFGERHVTVFPPVDGALFRPDAARRAAARAELAIADDAVAVATVGNRNPQKGLDWFVRAAALARERVPGLAARVLGAPSPGHEDYEETARREAAAAGLAEPQLRFADPGARVAELLPGIDVVVIASVPRSEGIPTVALEAMACGIPVVTTDVGAVREVIDAEVGLVVPPLDAVALADAIAALGGDPGRRARLGAAGRARIERDHGLDACAAGHLRAYELALRHAAGRRRR
jgi:glycosyltransferase involved in cell wall biosynthesis